MTPVMSTIRHDPNAGTWGDCHRAAVATVLDLPLDAVPHFWEGGPDPVEFKRREREFLASKGLVGIDLVYAGADTNPEIILLVVGGMNPGVPYLLGGATARGVNHVVVCVGEDVVHDPSDTGGIVGPCDDGWYWITFFGALYLDSRPRCMDCGAPETAAGLCTRPACANSD